MGQRHPGGSGTPGRGETAPAGFPEGPPAFAAAAARICSGVCSAPGAAPAPEPGNAIDTFCGTRALR